MVKIKKLVLIIVTLGLSIQLTGCWDVKRLENLNIPIASGYEVISKPNSDSTQMQVFGVFPVFNKSAPTKYIVDITKSDYIGEARSIRLQHLSEELNLGSLQTTVFGSNLARKGISKALNIIIRTPQMKNTITLSVAEDNIEDIFRVVPDNYPNMGIYLNTLLNEAFKQSYIPVSDVHHVSVALYTPGWHAIIPMIKADEKKIIISGYGIFKGDKLASTITIEEARILSVLSSLPSSGTWSYSITSNGKYPCTATVRMENTAKIMISRDNSGYHINVSIKSKGTLEELLAVVNHQSIDNTISDKENLLKNKALVGEIEKGYEKLLKEQSEALIHKAQNEFKMDIFNWVKYAQAKWRKDIDNIDWDNCFSSIDVNVTVKANLNYIGEET